MAVDAPQQSPLLQLPAELRRQIYAHIVPPQVHLHHHHGTIRPASCVSPGPSNDYYCFDRRSLGDPPPAVWARRLTSSWGDHWRCEELARCEHEHNPAMALMTLCRRIYEDVVYLLADTRVIHINDITTLELLFNCSSRSSNLWTRAFFHARRLHLSLRLPPPVFKALAAKTKAVPSAPSSPWLRLWHNITRLPRLQRIDITLDHNSEASWSTVDEHAVLAPLQTLASDPAINTAIHLPNVASPPPHDAVLGRTIQRFTRQRFFAEYRKDGTIGVIYEEDAYKSFRTSGPRAAEALRAAELTMHIWFQGVNVDYVAMDESLRRDDDDSCDAL